MRRYFSWLGCPLLVSILSAQEIWNSLELSNFSPRERAHLLHCPCANPTLCFPIPPQDFPAQEVFVFSTNDRLNASIWKSYHWHEMTTIAWNTNKELLCHAHQHHVRVVIKHNFDQMKDICNSSVRKIWIQTTYDRILEHYADGVNIDTEKPIEKATEATCLSSLVAELRVFLTTRPFTSRAQISFDVPWSPHGIDRRFYDYAGLARASDFLFVMAYDVRSQVYDFSLAGSNTPLAQIAAGVDEYLRQIPPSKLVLGLAWYGYQYQCQEAISGTPHPPVYCTIDQVPFFDAPCSDAAGTQVDYKHLIEPVWNGDTPERFDPITDTPSWTQMAKGHWVQAWYDNPQSTCYKRQLMDRRALRGIGVWHVDGLEYEDANQAVLTKAMWTTMTTTFPDCANLTHLSIT